VGVLADFSFTLNRFLSVKNFAKQGPGKYDPDGRFVHGRFVPHGRFVLTDVLSTGRFVQRTFCPHGRFVRRTFCCYGRLSPQTFCPYGRFVHGRFVSVRFVWAPLYIYHSGTRKNRSLCMQEDVMKDKLMKSITRKHRNKYKLTYHDKQMLRIPYPV
jgi:hypothetical protein